MVAFATQSNIQTTGADIVPIGANGAGKSKLLTAAELRAFATLYSSSQVDTLLAAKQATLVSGTNLKSINGTTLLGSGDLTVSATPAGSSGQVQFNSAGSFGGAAALVYAATGTHVSITSQAAANVPLCVKGAASQSGNLSEWQNSSGTILTRLNNSGQIIIPSGGLRSSSDPTNRYFDPENGWSTNLQATIYSYSLVRLLAQNTQSGFSILNETLSGNVWGTGNKSVTVKGWDCDSVPNRGVCELIISAGNAHSSGQTNTGQGVSGANVTIRGGNGASAATTAAANGGDVILTPGLAYGTGARGRIVLSFLPTSDPAVVGALWNDGGTIKISAG